MIQETLHHAINQAVGIEIAPPVIMLMCPNEYEQCVNLLTTLSPLLSMIPEDMYWELSGNFTKEYQEAEKLYSQWDTENECRKGGRPDINKILVGQIKLMITGLGVD